MVQSIDEDLRQALTAFPEIELAMLFGSLASGSTALSADLDIAVGGRRKLPSALRRRLVKGLAELVGRPVDLIDLATVGEPLLGVVLRTGRLILCRDRRLYAELIKRHIFNVADFEPYRRRLLKQRREAWIEN